MWAAGRPVLTGIDRLKKGIGGDSEHDQQPKPGPFILGHGLTVGVEQVAQPADGIEQFQRPALGAADAVEVEPHRLEHRAVRPALLVE